MKKEIVFKFCEMDAAMSNMSRRNVERDQSQWEAIDKIIKNAGELEKRLSTLEVGKEPKAEELKRCPVIHEIKDYNLVYKGNGSYQVETYENHYIYRGDFVFVGSITHIVNDIVYNHYNSETNKITVLSTEMISK